MKKHPRNKIHSNAKTFGDIFWTIIIIVCLCSLASTCNGQIGLQIRSGIAFKSDEPIISPAVNFAAHGFALAPEMIVTFKDNSPAYFGLKISYQYKFIEAGYGKYFSLYSTDKYDSYKNGWINNWFVIAHWKIWFIEANTLGQSISLGVRETIGRLQ